MDVDQPRAFATKRFREQKARLPLDLQRSVVPVSRMTDAAGPVYEWLCHVKEPVEFARLDPADVNTLSTCDSFVIAFAGKKDAETIAAELPLPAGAPRYAVCDREPVLPGWSGALVVDDLAGLPRLMRKPRLGHARRPFSEACDRFLLAVRTGAGFGVEHARGRRF